MTSCPFHSALSIYLFTCAFVRVAPCLCSIICFVCELILCGSFVLCCPYTYSLPLVLGFVCLYYLYPSRPACSLSISLFIFAAAYQIPMRPCIVFRMTLLTTTAISSIVISVFGCNAPLVRAVKLLSMRALGVFLLRRCRVSKGDQSFFTGLGGDSGRGCLQTVVLYGTESSMPSAWCSKCARGDAILFDGSSIRDVANVVRGDELSRKLIGDRILCVVTMMRDVWASSLRSVFRNLNPIVVVVDDGRVVLVTCSCVWCPCVPLAATVTLNGARPTLRDARPPSRGHLGQW